MKLSKFLAILGLSTSLVTFSSLSDTTDKVMAQCNPLDITCNPHIRERTKKVAEEAWGEAGRGLYQAGAAAIGEDNKRIPLKALTPRQKELLKPEFGSLVDRVRIKYGADMLDRWGSGDFVISPGSLGQTFCDRIYIQAPFNENDDSQLILLAHELEHSRQCEKFGGMSNFGYRYFKEFKKANQNYENNLLEREAREVASRFASYLASLPSEGQVSAGLYRKPDGTFISANNSGAYCNFVSPGHFEYLSGRYDLVKSVTLQNISNMDNHGPCQVKLSPGVYRIPEDGTFINSNGQAYCAYTSMKHYETADGRPVRQLPAGVPLFAMDNHGNCPWSW